jgi:RNA polymerase sigma-70 factor (ECF subfamily)
MQEVLMTICRKLKWVHTPELFGPWVYRIASRAAFRHLKRERRWLEQVRDESVLEETPAPETQPAAEILQHLLNADNIPPASRAVLALHFQEELSLPEVAAILEIPLGTVKSRLAYGLTALRKQFIRERGV